MKAWIIKNSREELNLPALQLLKPLVITALAFAVQKTMPKQLTENENMFSNKSFCWLGRQKITNMTSEN